MWTIRTSETEYVARSAREALDWAAQGRVPISADIYHPTLDEWVPLRDLETIQDFLAFRRRVCTPYKAWLWSLKNDDTHGGFFGWALIVILVPTALVGAFLGISLFPPGMYPRIVLAAPGVLVGLLFVWVNAPTAYKLTREFGPVLKLRMPCHHCCSFVELSGRQKPDGRCCPSCQTEIW